MDLNQDKLLSLIRSAKSIIADIASAHRHTVAESCDAIIEAVKGQVSLNEEKEAKLRHDLELVVGSPARRVYHRLTGSTKLFKELESSRVSELKSVSTGKEIK